MRVREVLAKAVLTRTAITGFDYCLNPYVGCGHGCRYCYASFMKRFTGHMEPWGTFVDVKINAPQRLKRELNHTRLGIVAISTVTDPYQPIEKKYEITRRCLEALLEKQFPVNILTRSPLCLRDLDLFKQFRDIEIGVSITTQDENIKKIFEPNSPSIESRMKTLKTLRMEKVRTYAFIGPLLPMDSKELVRMLERVVDEVLIDKMNYPNKVMGLYRQKGLEFYLSDDYFNSVGLELKEGFEKRGIVVSLIF